MTAPNSSSRTGPETHGLPGSGARAWGWWHALSPAMGLLALIGFVLGSALRPAWLSGGTAGLLLLGLALALGLVTWRGAQRLARHDRGAEGEEVVARELAGLPGSWRVFHGFPLDHVGGGGGRDVDHLVCGPRGVFLIETKNWRGRVEARDGQLLEDGRTYPGATLGGVAALAREVSDALYRDTGLRTEVHPVVCLAGGRLAAGNQEVDGVWVCERDGLLGWLQSDTLTPMPDGMESRVAAWLTQQVNGERS